MKTTIGIAIFLSIVFIIIGISLPFIELENYIKIKNDGYVSAIFSLSGVFLFFAALMYQIKEYRLQVDELKKSVEAQTKSSQELEAQKRILMEQNLNTMLFGMIESFNAFKLRNETDYAIKVLINYYKDEFNNDLLNVQSDSNLSNKELNVQFAIRIKESFSSTIVKQKYYLIFKKYIQFIYNILTFIDMNKEQMTGDIFTPFLLSQLNTNETILLYLSNLVSPPDMPYYGNLNWDYYITKDIVEMIKGENIAKLNYIDYTRIDYALMTKKFKDLKQL